MSQPTPKRTLPVWAIALIAAAVVLVGVVVVVGVTTFGSEAAERSLRTACGDAVEARLGTGVSDVDTTKYPALVREVDGPGPGQAYRVEGQVDFMNAGQPDRAYYTCDATRSGGTTTVTSVTGL